MDIEVAKDLIVLLSDAVELQKATRKMKDNLNKNELSALLERKVDEIKSQVEDL